MRKFTRKQAEWLQRFWSKRRTFGRTSQLDTFIEDQTDRKVNMPLKTEPYILKIVAKMGEAYHTIIEDQIELSLRPKPRWIPQRIWRWLLSKLLRLEVWKQS